MSSSLASSDIHFNKENNAPLDNWATPGSSGARADVFRLSSTQEEFAALDTMLLSQPLSQPNSSSVNQTEQFLQGIRTSYKQLCDEKDADECRIIELDEAIKSYRERYNQQQQILLDLQMQQEKLNDQKEAGKKDVEVMNVKMQEYQQIVKAISGYCENLSEANNQMSAMSIDLLHVKDELKCAFKGIKTKAIDVKNEYDMMVAVMLQVSETREKRKRLAKAANDKKEETLKQHKKEMEEWDAKLLQNKITIRSLESELETIQRNNERMKQKELEVAKEDDEEIENLQKELDSYSMKYTVAQADLKKAQLRNDEANALKKKFTLELEIMNQRVLNLQADHADHETTVKSLLLENAEMTTLNQQSYEELKKIITQNSQMETEVNSICKVLAEQREFNLKRIAELKDTLNCEKARGEDEVDKLNKEIDLVNVNSNATSLKCDRLREELATVRTKLSKEKEENEKLSSLNSDLVKQITQRKHEKENITSTLEDLTKLLNLEKVKVFNKEAELCELKEQAEMETKLCLQKVNEKKCQVSSIKQMICAKREHVSSLSQKWKQLKNNSDSEKSANDNNYSAAIKELNDTISTLEKELQKVKKDNQTFTQNQLAQLDQLEKHHLLKKKEVNNAEVDLDMVSKSVEKGENDLISLESEIKEIEKSEHELVETLSNQKESVHASKKKVVALSAAVKKKAQEVLGKEIKVAELKQQIEDLDKAKTDAIAKNSEEMKMLFHDMTKSRQFTESLSITANQLSSELEELKKIHVIAISELEKAVKKREELDEKYSETNSEIEKKRAELEEIAASLHKDESQHSKSKAELKTVSHDYQRICRVIAKSKEKAKKQKENTDRANLKVSEVARGDNDNFKDVSTASTSKKDTTPRSILKPSSKPPTPQSARKNVSFSQTTEEINSSASTIVME